MNKREKVRSSSRQQQGLAENTKPKWSARAVLAKEILSKRKCFEKEGGKKRKNKFICVFRMNKVVCVLKMEVMCVFDQGGGSERILIG